MATLDEPTISLREHLEALRADDKEALKIALEAASTAVGKAEQAQSKVNETQNEFRGTLKDQAATLMPRTETEQLIKALREESERGRAGIQKDVDALKTSSTAIEGRSKGLNAGWIYLIGALGAIGTLFGIIGSIIGLVVLFG